MRRSRVKPKRSTPRRREAPRWGWDEWLAAAPTFDRRSNGVCEWCGGPGPFERHHRKRRRDGGDRFANIIILCGGPEGCHRWVTEHPARARQVGLIVSVARDPALVPFLYRRHTWMWLDDDGTTRVFDGMPADGDAHDVWA